MVSQEEVVLGIGAACAALRQAPSDIAYHPLAAHEFESARTLHIRAAEKAGALNSKRRLLIVDNASWHKAQRLHWHHFEVHYLPGYSPDFNPIERLWLRLKADFFSDFIAKSPEELTQRLCHALTSLINAPKKIASRTASGR